MTTHRIASSETCSSFLHSIKSESGSDSQMPLYQAAMFVWEKLFGKSEWGMRSINLAFWLIGVWALSLAIREFTFPAWSAIITAASSSFLWYYLNEARPYLMQFAGASLLACAYWKTLIHYKEQKFTAVCANTHWLMFVSGSLLCAGASMLGTPLAGIIFLLTIYLRLRHRHSVTRADTLWISVWVLVLTGLAFYYGWTLIEEKGASTANKTSLASLAFIAFEMLGFMPFGPGRLDLREQGLPSLIPWFGFLIVWGLCVTLLLSAGMTRCAKILSEKKILLLTLLPFILTASFLLLSGYLGGFRILGRHLMPVFPFLVVLIAIGYSKLLSGSLMQKTSGFLVLTLALFGCLTQRYAHKHQKDDYRGAVTFVNQFNKSNSSKNNTIWWVAANTIPSYNFDKNANVEEARWFKQGSLNTLPTPGLIAISKPDLYDPAGVIQKWINKNQFALVKTLPAFKFYQKTIHPKPNKK